MYIFDELHGSFKVVIVFGAGLLCEVIECVFVDECDDIFACLVGE